MPTSKIKEDKNANKSCITCCFRISKFRTHSDNNEREKNNSSLSKRDGVGLSDIEMRLTRENMLTNSDNNEREKNKIKLFEAVDKDDDVQCVEILSNDPHLLAERDNSGNTVFHIAAKGGHKKSMTQLLHFMDNVGVNWYKRPIYYRTKDGNKARAWHLALEHCNKELAYVLINDAMPPQMAYDANKSGLTVELAIKAGYKDLVEHMFLRAPWKFLSRAMQLKLLRSSSIVHDAINTRDIGMLQIVLDNMPTLMESLNRGPLSYAIHKGYYEEVCYMLDNFPNSVNKEPVPIIHTAVMGGHIDIVKELISRFPESMNHYNLRGQTPLSLAAHNGDINIILYFLNNFPNYTKVCNKDGSYPIHEAVAFGHIEVVKEFISRCPETMYQVDARGRSILHIVVECNKLDVLSYLKENVELKNIFHLRDDNGNTFADLAKQKKMKNDQPSNRMINFEAKISAELPKNEKRSFRAFLKKKMKPLMVCTWSNNGTCATL